LIFSLTWLPRPSGECRFLKRSRGQPIEWHRFSVDDCSWRNEEMWKTKIILSVISIIAIAFAQSATAQSHQTVAKVGFLTSDFEPSELGIAFQKEMRDLGYVEGKNIHIEYRGAARNLDRLEELAGDLVGLDVAAIVAVDTATTLAAKSKTKDIPII